MISGERTEQLDIFCHVTGFTSDFLSFIDVKLIRFFHWALQLKHLYLIVNEMEWISENQNILSTVLPILFTSGQSIFFATTAKYYSRV